MLPRPLFSYQDLGGIAPSRGSRSRADCTQTRCGHRAAARSGHFEIAHQTSAERLTVTNSRVAV